eukprot:Partr_v1_DN25131_c1_g1_i1_m76969 putative arginine N-methyltransferase 2
MTSDQVDSTNITISDDLRFAVRLMEAIKNHKHGDSIVAISTLLKVAAQNEYTWFQDSKGRAPLHIACMLGHMDICQLLITVGHPWNCQDDDQLTPAELARDAGYVEIYEYMLQEAVRSQLLLNLIDRKDTPKMQRMASSEAYLGDSVKYSDTDRLLLADAGDAVMMEWERPLMAKHASVVCQMDASFTLSNDESSSKMSDRNSLSHMPRPEVDGGEEEEPFRVLNVGFGLGIVDSFIHNALVEKARENPTRRFVHYIMEAHPGVHAKMAENGWVSTSTTNPELVIFKSSWQDAVEEIYSQGLQFDGIFFDTFGEDYSCLQDWHEHVGNLLKSDPHAIYSFFNGLGARNDFFNHVYSEIVEVELRDMGLETEWQMQKVDIAEEEWKDIKHRYFTLKHYRFPICKWSS